MEQTSRTSSRGQAGRDIASMHPASTYNLGTHIDVKNVQIKIKKTLKTFKTRDKNKKRL